MESLFRYVRSFFISDISDVSNVVGKADSSGANISAPMTAVVPVSSISTPEELIAPVSLEAVPEIVPEVVPELPPTQIVTETETKIDPNPVVSAQSASTLITTPPSQSSEHKQTKKHKKRKH